MKQLRAVLLKRKPQAQNMNHQGSCQNADSGLLGPVWNRRFCLSDSPPSNANSAGPELIPRAWTKVLHRLPETIMSSNSKPLSS